MKFTDKLTNMRHTNNSFSPLKAETPDVSADAKRLGKERFASKAEALLVRIDIALSHVKGQMGKPNVPDAMLHKLHTNYTTLQLRIADVLKALQSDHGDHALDEGDHPHEQMHAADSQHHALSALQLTSEYHDITDSYEHLMRQRLESGHERGLRIVGARVSLSPPTQPAHALSMLLEGTRERARA